MSIAKDITKQILSKYNLSGSVYSDNLNGNPRVLIEKCELEEEKKDLIKKEIKNKVKNITLYW